MAGPNVTVTTSADMAKAVAGVQQVLSKFQGTESAIRQTKAAAREAEGGIAKIGDAAHSAGQAAIGMVAGYVSISGAMRAYAAFADRLKEIRDLTKSIGEAGTGAQTALENVVPKLGLRGSEGFKEAQRYVREIVDRTGAAPGEAISGLGAAAIETKGSAEQKFNAAMTMAAFSKGAGLAPEESAGLWDFVDASTPQRMQGTLGKIRIGARAATAGVGEFAGPLLKAAPELSQLGFSEDQIIAMTAQAMDTAGGLAKPSAKVLAGLSDTLRDPKTLELLRKHAHLKKDAELSGPAALAELQAMQSDPKDQAKLLKTLGADRLAVLGRFTSKSATGAEVAGQIAAGVKLPAEESFLPDTALGMARSTQARMGARSLSTAERAELKAGIDREAEQLLNEAKAAGNWRDWLSNAFTPDEMQLKGARSLAKLQRLGKREGGRIDGETVYSDPYKFEESFERTRRFAGAT